MTLKNIQASPFERVAISNDIRKAWSLARKPFLTTIQAAVDIRTLKTHNRNGLFAKRKSWSDLGPLYICLGCAPALRVFTWFSVAVQKEATASHSEVLST